MSAPKKRKIDEEEKQFKVTLETAEDTEKFGCILSRIAKAGDVIALNGELGAGKTCIARGFIRDFFRNPGLDVPSPSYLLCLSYADDRAYSFQDNTPVNTLPSKVDARAGTSRVQGAVVYHIDPYRLGGKNKGKLAALIDWRSVFENDIALVEWPDKVGSNIIAGNTPERLVVTIEGIGPQSQGRILALRGIGERWTKVVQDWQQNGLPQLQEEDVGMGIAKPIGVPTLQDTPVNIISDDEKQSEGTFKKLAEDQESWCVLGIETSCDDTAAAVVRGDGTILGEAIASQAQVHIEWGGVKPDAAMAAHKEAIDRTVQEALTKAGMTADQLTAVGVTVGPGLALCLDIGVKKALQLTAQHKLPLVRVHHMEAHAMITRLPSQPLSKHMQFPALLLLVSGGHNMLVLTNGIGKHRILGSTLDDSIGEAFDKTARLLGIEHIPGGPHLEEMATEGDPKAYQLPVPLTKGNVKGALKDNCDYSFAGLKTNVRTLVENEVRRIHRECEEDEEKIAEAKKKVFANIAASFQVTCIKHLLQRTERGIQWEKDNIKCMVVAGGVAANKLLRSELEKLTEKFKIPLVCPPIRLCMDNGIMVAWTAVERLKLGLYEAPPAEHLVDLHVEVRPRWPIGPRDPRSLPKPGAKNAQ